jgi:hypothetical protein
VTSTRASASRSGGVPATRPCARCASPEYQQSDRFRQDIARLAAEMPVRAILPGLEYSVEAAAVAAELQGLPGGGPAAARILRDKL